jgi:hypothetical protein
VPWRMSLNSVPPRQERPIFLLWNPHQGIRIGLIHYFFCKIFWRTGALVSHGSAFEDRLR